jgi:hypothetical protein
VSGFAIKTELWLSVKVYWFGFWWIPQLLQEKLVFILCDSNFWVRSRDGLVELLLWLFVISSCNERCTIKKLLLTIVNRNTVVMQCCTLSNIRGWVFSVIICQGTFTVKNCFCLLCFETLSLMVFVFLWDQQNDFADVRYSILSLFGVLRRELKCFWTNKLVNILSL